MQTASWRTTSLMPYELALHGCRRNVDNLRDASGRRGRRRAMWAATKLAPTSACTVAGRALLDETGMTPSSPSYHSLLVPCAPDTEACRQFQAQRRRRGP